MYQESVGMQVGLKAIQVVRQLLEGKQLNSEPDTAEIYTWSEVIPYPEGDAALDEGWYNFQWAEQGQRLGHANGDEIKSTVSGPILFPKYIRESSGGVRPKEICRVMKKISAEELGG